MTSLDKILALLNEASSELQNTYDVCQVNVECHNRLVNLAGYLGSAIASVEIAQMYVNNNH